MGLDMYLYKINKVAKDSKDVIEILESKKCAPLKEQIDAYNLLLKDKPFEALAAFEPWNRVELECFKYNEEDKEVRYNGTGIELSEYMGRVAMSISRLYNELVPEVAEYINCEDKESYVSKEEISYWRKHPDLHEYMERVYVEKGGEATFNCEYLVLTKEDVEKLVSQLSRHISGEDSDIQETTGFFFGQTDPEDFKEDLELFNKVLKETEWDKETIMYYSWW